MYNGKLVSLEMVAERVATDYGFKVDWSEAAEWTGTAMRLIGVPNAYVDKMAEVPIEDYRGNIPCDCLNVDHIVEKDIGIGMTGSSDMKQVAYSDNEDNDDNKYSYTLNNDYIFASFEEGCVQVYYTAWPTDDKGFPMIPDNEKYIEAMKCFIAERIAFRMWMKDEISDKKYQKVESERLWYMAAAKTSMSMPSVDQMEGIKNIILRSIPRLDEHSNSYKNTSSQEQRYNK